MINASLVGSLLTLCRAMAVSIWFLGVAAGVARGEENTPLTPDEAAEELASLTARLTPFTASYDRATKVLTYREIVESGDATLNNRHGELQVRLDRLDPKLMNYQASKGMFLVHIRGRQVVGQMYFFCRKAQRCVRRGFPDSVTGVLTADETDEEGYIIDVVEGHVINDMLRYAGLLQVLIADADADAK